MFIDKGPPTRADAAGPEVATDKGIVRGMWENGLAVFRGIPYAKAPVGALRFAAPVQRDPWFGVRETTEFGPPPPQPNNTTAFPRSLLCISTPAFRPIISRAILFFR